MGEAKFIQNIDVDNNEIKNVRLQDTPNLADLNIKGKFGLIDGAIAYIAGYDGVSPIVNYLRELIPYEDGDFPSGIQIIKGINGFKDGIALDRDTVYLIIIDDNEISDSTTWSSQRIIDYFSGLTPTIIQEETITYGLTSAELEDLYPDALIGTVVFSKANSTEYTKMNDTEWKIQVIEIV